MVPHLNDMATSRVSQMEQFSLPFPRNQDTLPLLPKALHRLFLLWSQSGHPCSSGACPCSSPRLASWHLLKDDPAGVSLLWGPVMVHGVTHSEICNVFIPLTETSFLCSSFPPTPLIFKFKAPLHWVIPTTQHTCTQVLCHVLSGSLASLLGRNPLFSICLSWNMGAVRVQTTSCPIWPSPRRVYYSVSLLQHPFEIQVWVFYNRRIFSYFNATMFLQSSLPSQCLIQIPA